MRWQIIGTGYLDEVTYVLNTEPGTVDTQVVMYVDAGNRHWLRPGIEHEEGLGRHRMRVTADEC